MVRSLSTWMSPSTKVSGDRLRVSQFAAASTAAWIEVWSQPEAQTVRVAPWAVPASRKRAMRAKARRPRVEWGR